MRNRPTWLALTVVALLGIVPALLRAPNVDEAWLIYVARQLLNGAELGVDYLEVTPPLAIWKSFVPLLLEPVTGLPVWWLSVFMLSGLVLLSLMLVREFLGGLAITKGRASALLVAAAFAALVVPRMDFTEREQYAFILTLPYVVLAAVRMSSGLPPRAGAAALAGLLGAAGFSFKPHFLIPWLLIELVLLVRSGRDTFKRPELLALMLLWFALGMALILIVPEYVPMALRLAPWYSAYLNNGVIHSLGLAGPVLLLIPLVALAHRVAVPPPEPLRDAFGLAFVGYLAAAVVQMKGLSYHYLAAWGFGVLLLTLAWPNLPTPRLVRPSALLLRLGQLILVGVTLERVVDTGVELRDLRGGHRSRDASYSSLLATLRDFKEGQSILILSSNPGSGWPLTLEAGATWASRYPSLWLLAALYSPEIRASPTRAITGRPEAEQSEFERRFIGEVIADFTRFRPRYLLVLTPDVSVQAWGGARQLDYLTYFGKDPRFVSLLDDYIEIESIDPYRIWKRRRP